MNLFERCEHACLDFWWPTVGQPLVGQHHAVRQVSCRSANIIRMGNFPPVRQLPTVTWEIENQELFHSFMYWIVNSYC